MVPCSAPQKPEHTAVDPTPSLLAEALRLYRAGVPVTPARPGKKPGWGDDSLAGKKNIYAQRYLDHQVTEADLERWFLDKSTAGLGVLPGQPWRFWRDGLQHEVRVLDFESTDVFDIWCGRLAREGHAALLERL